jgi:putative folate metabolism gamma-glutamate ligase
MKIKTIKTHKITYRDKDILSIIDKYINKLPDNSIMAVTSKIISICEGSVIKIDKKTNKDKLIKQEADRYIPKEKSKYGFYLTLKNNVLIPSSGIDESNGDGYYILWPRNPQKSANNIRKYLIDKFHIKNIGVIITDSKTTPLRWGTTGISIANCGFMVLNSYVSKPDIFGKKLEVTKANIADGLAAAAVLEMGEGKEQTPIAIIEDIKYVKFQKQNPSKKELKSLNISIEDDLYASLLTGVKWKR